jgi:hypothetical protein
MRPFLTFILTLLFGFSYGQDFFYPTINKKGQNISDFIPAGWAILDTAVGDLNGDKVNDAAIILQYKDSVSIIKTVDDILDSVVTQPRIFIVLFKNANDMNFYLVEQSNSFILNHDDPIMEDPYQGLKIDKCILQIDFYFFCTMGCWYTTSSSYKFRYKENQFLLIGADLFTIHRTTLDYEDYSYNFLTQKRRLITGNDQKGTKKTNWKMLAISTCMTLKAFNEPLTWEIETGIYL